MTRSLAISIRTCWPWKAGDDLHHSSRDLCTCDFQPEGLERDSDHVGRLEGGESQHRSEDGGHMGGDQGWGDSLRSHNRTAEAGTCVKLGEGGTRDVRSAVSECGG